MLKSSAERHKEVYSDFQSLMEKLQDLALEEEVNLCPEGTAMRYVAHLLHTWGTPKLDLEDTSITAMFFLRIVIEMFLSTYLSTEEIVELLNVTEEKVEEVAALMSIDAVRHSEEVLRQMDELN